MKKLQLLVLGLLFTSWGFAQESDKKSYSYNLDEAIAHALQYSSEAINAERDVQEARHKKWETTADGLPQIDGSVSYMNNIAIQQSVIPAEAFGGPPGLLRAVEFGVKQNMDAKLTLNQLLFSGSYLVALKASKTYQQYVQNNKLKTEADIREMVVNTYGNVLLVEESLRILDKNKATVQANYKEMKAFLENGLTEEENVEQLEITLASIENTIKFNTKLKNTTYQMLKLTLGMELEDELVITDSLERLAQKNAIKELTEEPFDITKNLDYQIVKTNETSEMLFLKLEKSRRLPSLVSFANFGANSFSADGFTFANSTQPWYDYSNFGVQLNVPIFSSFKSGARIQQYKIKYEKAKTLTEDTNKRIQLAWESAKGDYQYAIDQYQTAQRTLQLAERIESKQQMKFREGLSTSFEFTEAQRQLYTEQQNSLKAMLEVINKRAALEKIENKQ